ncbi:MAG: hypothetical protein PW791_13345 [Neorhizobium sp.]|jgi:hypothetical protein|nr:hypothetical protein [Neorhizobium sp.]
MPSRQKLIAVAIALLAGASSAGAQSNLAAPFVAGRGQVPAGYTSMSVNLGLNIPTDEKSDIDAQIETAQVRAYKLAGRQCDLVKATIASDCRIMSVDGSVNTQRPMQATSISINLRVSLAVKLKE